MEQKIEINNVVLIDDDPITNMINTKILQNHFKTKVNAFTSASIALDELKGISDSEKIPDVIFLDINMPNIDGWQFLAEYEKLPSKQWQHCKLYMLSSSIDFGDIDKSKTFTSVKGFISKPLLPNTLVDLVSKDNSTDLAA